MGSGHRSRRFKETHVVTNRAPTESLLPSDRYYLLICFFLFFYTWETITNFSFVSRYRIEFTRGLFERTYAKNTTSSTCSHPICVCSEFFLSLILFFLLLSLLLQNWTWIFWNAARMQRPPLIRGQSKTTRKVRLKLVRSLSTVSRLSCSAPRRSGKQASFRLANLII